MTQYDHCHVYVHTYVEPGLPTYTSKIDSPLCTYMHSSGEHCTNLSQKIISHPSVFMYFPLSDCMRDCTCVLRRALPDMKVTFQWP